MTLWVGDLGWAELQQLTYSCDMSCTHLPIKEFHLRKLGWLQYLHPFSSQCLVIHQSSPSSHTGLQNKNVLHKTQSCKTLQGIANCTAFFLPTFFIKRNHWDSPNSKGGKNKINPLIGGDTRSLWQFFVIYAKDQILHIKNF